MSSKASRGRSSEWSKLKSSIEARLWKGEEDNRTHDRGSPEGGGGERGEGQEPRGQQDDMKEDTVVVSCVLVKTIVLWVSLNYNREC